MGFSSRRSRWRLSVMRRDRHWGRCLATSGNTFVRASTHHDADPANVRRQRPCGSRRTRRRSARGPEGQPEAPGVGPRRPRWSGPDPMVVWNGSRPSRAVGAAPDTPRPPSGRNAAGARPGGLDDFGLPRGTRRLGRDGVDDERSPLLRDSKTMLEGSRGGSASLPAHSTSPFQSPRGRMSVASSHVPHPRPCDPRSCWDRCTILHIRGAAGPQRRPSHRSAPPKRCTIMSIMKHDREGHSIDFYPGGYFDYFDRI